MFKYYLPVSLVFGEGVIGKLGELASAYGKRALIVTGKSSARKTGILDIIETQLKLKGIESVVFEQVAPNPIYSTADAGAELAKEAGCDFVIGVGGGSSIDTAKAIAVGVKNDGSVWDYVENKGTGNKYPSDALPVIAIVTNAGTGSEVNRFAVLTNPETKEKPGITSPYIYPRISIIDPQLMTSVPPKVTAESGLDIIFQALESYVNKEANPITDIYAEKAVELVYENLQDAYQEGSNVEARKNLALASLLAGMANDQVPCVLLHALEHPLSGHYNIPHGTGLAILFSAVFNFNLDYTKEKLARLYRLVTKSKDRLSDKEAAQKFILMIEQLIADVGQNYTLKDMGVKEESFMLMASQALTTMTRGITNNPRTVSLEQMLDIYREAM